VEQSMDKSFRQPLVSIVIVTWNRVNEVVKCINSALNQTYSPIEVLVVDNASTDETLQTIKMLYPQVRIIRLHRNVGCPEGRNIGFSNAKGDILFALDDDGWLEKQAIEKIVGRFNVKPTVGVIQAKILDGRKNPIKSCYMYEFSGGASAIKREVIDKAGYYPHDFFRQGEESDLAIRILEAGYDIIYYPDAMMYHKPSKICRQGKNKILRYQIINSTRVAVKYYPLFYLFLFIICKWTLHLFKGIFQGNLRVFYDVFCLIPAICASCRQRRPVSLSVFKNRQRLKKAFNFDNSSK
jgi:GT2 family glycosyltransferase